MMPPTRKIHPSYTTILHLTILLVLTVLLTVPALFEESFRWPDESRHAMDGVFFLDFLKDRPFSDIYRYTERYYARYPALAFTWYPPFFAMSEAVFYGVFGISIATAKLTVIFFAELAVFFWYLSIEKMLNRQIAFFSSLFFITSPVVVEWSQTVMLEIPTIAMIILCVYCAYQYVERNKKVYVYFLALSLCGALYTKQLAVFMIPVFLLYFFIQKKQKYLFRKEALLSYGLMMLLLIPLGLFTLRFSNVGLHTTVGELKEVGLWITSLQSLSVYFTWPVVLLAGTSLIVFIIHPGEWKKYGFFLAWIISWYLWFSYYFGLQPYYGIYIAPPLCLLSAFALNFFMQTCCPVRTRRALAPLALLAICAYQLFVSCTISRSYASDTIYDRAAEFVVRQPRGVTVLISAFYDGNFIFHLRKHDDGDNKMLSLRADKMLVSFSVLKKWGMDSYVNTENDIYEMLRDYGTGYVVIEEPPLGEHEGIKALEMLKDLVKESGNFTLLKQFESIELSREAPQCYWRCPKREMKDIRLSIYEYHDMTIPQAEELVIHFPQLGREIRMPFKKLQHKKDNNSAIAR